MIHRTDILLRSGTFFDFLTPEQSSITIEDIAHALSHESRYNGHTSAFYSVAQHSVMVSILVPPEHALAGLLHDCTEAVLKDIPKPLKRLLPDYRALEKTVESAMLAKFGISLPLDPSIKHADMIMLATEKRDLMPPHEHDDCRNVAPLQMVLVPQAPNVAKRSFLRRYQQLTGLAVAA